LWTRVYRVNFHPMTWQFHSLGPRRWEITSAIKKADTTLKRIMDDAGSVEAIQARVDVLEVGPGIHCSPRHPTPDR